jgi:hypothetical protein
MEYEFAGLTLAADRLYCFLDRNLAPGTFLEAWAAAPLEK